MVPVRTLKANEFGEEMVNVSKWYDKKSTEKTLNHNRKIQNLITYPNEGFEVRSTVLSHCEWYQLAHLYLMDFVIKW